MSDDDETAFTALPPSLRRRIDQAFNHAVHATDQEPSPKRQRLDHSPQPGGFILDDSPAPGGFFVDEPIVRDDSPVSEITPSYIPLSLIPTALQHLDLQPDDEDVLSVFRNAASGWADQSSSSATADALVSRKDWHAVCAALLDTGAPEDEDGDVDMADRDRLRDPDDAREGLDSPLSDSGEEYLQSDSENNGDSAPDDDDDDDDYKQGGFTRPKGNGKTRHSTRGAARRSRSPSSGQERTGERHSLTARQKRECRAAFALFFPDVAEEELDGRRIAIKDITRVASLLKQKISAEETVEMLEAFSSMPDKSMTLGDFERMMITAKMA